MLIHLFDHRIRLLLLIFCDESLLSQLNRCCHLRRDTVGYFIQNAFLAAVGFNNIREDLRHNQISSMSRSDK